jgi:hypothetical protein
MKPGRTGLTLQINGVATVGLHSSPTQLIVPLATWSTLTNSFSFRPVNLAINKICSFAEA